jgi:hypothetical protein
MTRSVYFELHSDDTGMPVRWFPGDPQTARDFVIDPQLLADAEIGPGVQRGEKVLRRLLTVEGARYPLSIYPDGVCEIDAREFSRGRHYRGPVPVALPLDVDGPRPEFTIGSFHMPIVSRELAEIIEGLCPGDVERFPVTVLPVLSGYEILNVVATADCVDEQRTRHITRWTLDSARPDRAGQYHVIAGLVIDPARTNGQGIFRVRDWDVALIVSHRVKVAMEKIGNLGVVFEPVT